MQSGTVQSETTEDFESDSPTAASSSLPEVTTPVAVFTTIAKTAMGVVTSGKEFEAGVGESLSKSSVEVDAVGNVAIGDNGARVGEDVGVDAVRVDAVGDD